MKYHIYKLKFDTGVHFGRKGLADYDICFHADSMFSALCQESLRLGGQEMLHRLVKLMRENKLQISDAFPFKENELYIPKPYFRIENQDGDSSIKKKFKKMKYIQVNNLQKFVEGEYPIEKAVTESDFGKCQTKTSVAIRGMEETEPYSIKSFVYKKESGLYMIIGYSDEEELYFLEEILESLSYSGIGGKRYAGLGRFTLFPSSIPAELEKRLTSDGEVYMTLSMSLPLQDELEHALNGASYQLVKRSGFVNSENYSDVYMRKKDLYVFASGSCFFNKYQGDIYDVSSEGSHPVYRYAKPMFLEVK